MRTERFSLDANILVYVLSPEEPVKSALAQKIVSRAAAGNCALTLQSLGEFYSVATRKRAVNPAHAAEQVEDWLTIFQSLSPNEHCVRSAVGYAVAGRASYWDALLMATAAENGCTAVITEDMADGAMFGGARVVHPFDGDRLSEAVSALLG